MDDQYVVRSFSMRFTKKNAENLFETGNILRYIAVFVLTLHAIDAILRKRKQYEVTIFAALQLVDIIARIPLCTFNLKVSRAGYDTVIRFGWLYIWLFTLYLIPIIGWALSLAISALLCTGLILVVRNTTRI